MTRIKIELPSDCYAERKYIVDHIFTACYSLNVVIIVNPDIDSPRLLYGDSKIIFNDSVFSYLARQWLNPELLELLGVIGYIDDQKYGFDRKSAVPILGLKNVNHKKTLFHISSVDESHVNFDIFGICFLILSRYEEFIDDERDVFGRFSSSQSLLTKFDILKIPIVDLYVNWLGNVLQDCIPGLQIKKAEFKLQISCDVDHVYHCGTRQIKLMLRKLASDCLLRKDFASARRGVVSYIYAKKNNYSYDDYINSLRWMMDVCEDINVPICFNFIAGREKTKYDGCYDIEEKIVKSLLTEMNIRGHNIGIHPSFDSYNNAEKFNDEVTRLRQVLDDLLISQKVNSGRQHYLRASQIETFRYWVDNDLEFDSTLGYSDVYGFRCGTSRNFKIYDIENREQMTLVEQPLVMMECSIIRPGDTNISKEILQVIKTNALEFRENIENTGGTFNLLWHNSELKRPMDRELFTDLVSSG